jgi:hypothetical protein
VIFAQIHVPEIMPSPYARVYPETVLDSCPIWKQLGIASLHETYQEKYGTKTAHAPYSGPRGHPQTLRQEAEVYKQAMREWREDEEKATELMARCITSTLCTPNSPAKKTSKIQRVEVQPTLKRRKSVWNGFVHKFFCIPHYGSVELDVN